MRTLNSQSDVIQFSPVAINFNPCSLRELLNIELEQKRTCLGELYTDMVSALADYSGAGNYQAGVAYTAGQVVRFTTNLQRLYFRAKVDTSALPTVATDWEQAPKFSGDCTGTYDDVFCSYLGPYFAYVVMTNRLPYIYTQITDLGLMQHKDGTSEVADDKAYTRTLTALHRDRAIIWTNFEEFMSLDAQKENECLEGWIGYEKESCGCTCGGRGCKKCRAAKLNVGGYDFG